VATVVGASIAWLFAIASSALSNAATPPAGNAGWTELDQAHGIAVYTRPYEGSTYPEVRASGTVCATLPQLVAFVEDVAAFEQWIPDTAEARLVDRPTPRAQIYYIRTSMPWPVRDRDMIFRLSETTVFDQGWPNDSSLTTAISVAIEGLPDYLPADARATRMKGVSGRWTFNQTGDRTRIDLDMHIEPGGGVPAWLARQRIVGTPTKMLANLKEHFETLCRAP
jgi:hypothetical protein